MTARPESWLEADGQTTLVDLFEQRVAKTPQALAYRFYSPKAQRWVELTWQQAADRSRAWRAVLANAGVQPGDRVAIMLRNSPEWVCVDQAVLALGAVTVGLFCTDTPGNNAAIVEDSGADVLVAVKQQWVAQLLEQPGCRQLSAMFVFAGVTADDDGRMHDAESALQAVPTDEGRANANPVVDRDTLASLVYAPGTTTSPLASMMSHRNLLWCARAMTDALPVREHEHSVSYMPLPHSYERVADVYRGMMTGATITFARHPRFLNLTLLRADATSLVAAPRVYERLHLELHRRMHKRSQVMRRLLAFTISLGYAVFEYRQGRARRHTYHVLWPLLRATVARRYLQSLGVGSLDYALCAGAALPRPVARTLIGLGLPLLQGYGLTEAGPVVSFNRMDDNDPNSVGRPLDGVETRVGKEDELLVRSPGVMSGYWQAPETTALTIDKAGWLHTGDKVSRLDRQHLYLTGRIKDVIALATGGKALPGPLEESLKRDTLVDNVIVVGEARPSLAAVVSCPYELLEPVMRRLGLDASEASVFNSARLENFYLKRFARLLSHFPVHAQIRHVVVTSDLWTRENGLLDATGRVRRRAVAKRYSGDINRLFGRRAGNEKTDVSQNTNLG